MQKTTFKLTNQELDFISDPNFMRLKQKLVRNLADALNGLGIWAMQTHFANYKGTHKVSKGENYLDQPYVVLDMPQLKADALNGKLRLMCWWGHYISLHFFFTATEQTWQQLQPLLLQNFWVLTGEDLFNNDLNHPDFTPITQLSQEQLPVGKASKICKRLGFDEFEKLEQEITDFLMVVKELSQ